MASQTASDDELTLALRRQTLTNVKLHGLIHEHEWQCAWQSVPHAVKGKRQRLTWETPYGDLTLQLTLKNHVLHIKKV